MVMKIIEGLSVSDATSGRAKAKRAMDQIKIELCGDKPGDIVSAFVPPGTTEVVKGVEKPVVIDNSINMERYNNHTSKLLNEYEQEITDRLSGPHRLKSIEMEYNNYKSFANPKKSKKEVIRDIRQTYRKLNNKYKTTALNIKNKALKEHDMYISDFNTRLNYFNSEESYASRMKKLLSLERKRKKDLELELNNIISNANTNNRKVIYEDYDLGNIKNTRKYLYYVYYLIFILYLVFGSFLSKQEYRNVYVWLAILMYVTLPYYIRHITNGIMFAYNQYIYMKDNKFSKNVYLDI
tara:strand:+ start:271 stop:1155 length:885 start_codon:yes stop_codon:yes gene_type:complete